MYLVFFLGFMFGGLLLVLTWCRLATVMDRVNFLKNELEASDALLFKERENAKIQAVRLNNAFRLKDATEATLRAVKLDAGRSLARFIADLTPLFGKDGGKDLKDRLLDNIKEAGIREIDLFSGDTPCK